MNQEANKGPVCLSFPVRVTSDNATHVSADLQTQLADYPGLPLVLDFAETDYVSSAGLRILLAIRKSGHELSLVNVSPQIYEILEMTGFTEMLPIQKRRRTISLEGAKLIGEGFSAKVYQVSPDAIVKLFIHDTSLEDIQRELGLAKEAFVLGIPTAISYDIVEAEGHFGVIFELINCGLLRDALLEKPEAYEKLLDNYADLLITLNTTDVGDTVLPDIQKTYLEDMETFLKERIPEADYASMRSFVESIPPKHTFVHGDCHVKNIMHSGSELLLIDMDTLSYGHPWFELAQLYSPYHLFPEIYEGNCEEFFGLPRALVDRIWDSLMERYYKGKPAEVVQQELSGIRRLAHIHFLMFLARYASGETENFTRVFELYRNC